MHGTVYDVVLTGGTIQPGDWVVWVRKDKNTDCSNALSNALTATDPGGLAFVGADGQLRVSVELVGGIDGATDPDPHDSILASNATEHPTSTYTMCHASASANKTYSEFASDQYRRVQPLPIRNSSRNTIHLRLRHRSYRPGPHRSHQNSPSRPISSHP